MKKNKPIILAGTACILLFIALAILMMANRLVEMDTTVYEGVAGLMTPRLTKILITITNMGDLPLVLILPACLLLYPKTRLRYGLPALCSLSVGAGANVIIKYFFLRPRPDLLRLVDEQGYSFPSGHAMSNMALFAMLVLLLCYYHKNKSLCVVALLLGSLWVGAIGFSRIYLGVHYFSDIVAGFALGFAVAVALFLVYGKIENIICNKKNINLSH